MDKAAKKTWYRKQGWRVIIPSEMELRRVVGKNADGTPKYKTIGGLFVSWMDVKKGQEIELYKTENWASVIPMAASIEY